MSRSGDVAQHFATDTGSARLAVGHHALGVVTIATPSPFWTWGIAVLALVDAQSGTAHALDALDDGTAGVILEGISSSVLPDSVLTWKPSM